MNYGPLEFAALLARRNSTQNDSAAVRAARDAAPDTRPANRLTIVSGLTALTRYYYKVAAVNRDNDDRLEADRISL